jgi:hypothetical protein
MRKAEFAVPAEVMVEFTEKMTDLELDNTLNGVTEDDEIIVEVNYEKDESNEIDQLEEYLQKLIDNMDECEEEEDDN